MSRRDAVSDACLIKLRLKGCENGIVLARSRDHPEKTVELERRVMAASLCVTYTLFE